MSEPLLLLLESSGPLCSVALANGTHLMGQLEVEEPNAHSTHMAPLVDRLLNEQGVSLKELDAVVINAGPGSYTGLRIGASLAKGFCFGRELPLIAVSALESMALAMRRAHSGFAHYLPLIDARRENAYAALYDATGQCISEETFVSLDKAYAQQLPAGIVLGGSGAKKANELLGTKLPSMEVRMEAAHLLPSALQRYSRQQWEDLMVFEPNYIKSVHITTPKKNRYPFS